MLPLIETLGEVRPGQWRSVSVLKVTRVSHVRPVLRATPELVRVSTWATVSHVTAVASPPAVTRRLESALSAETTLLVTSVTSVSQDMSGSVEAVFPGTVVSHVTVMHEEACQHHVHHLVSVGARVMLRVDSVITASLGHFI